MKTTVKEIKTLGDLEKCEWNRKFSTSFFWIQVKNLPKNLSALIGRDYIGINIREVKARMSNFTPVGRTFEVSESEQIKKHDGKNGEMLFLKGLYLSGEEKPSYFLEFWEYKKGKKLPDTKDFPVKKKDVSISD